MTHRHLHIIAFIMALIIANSVCNQISEQPTSKIEVR